MNNFTVITTGDTLKAKKHVPEIMGPGIPFFKDKQYKIKSIRALMVDLYDEYNDVDSFSLDYKYKDVNYLWDWFEKV